MNSRSVWIMLVLVLLLGGGVLWQLDREKSPAYQADRPLCEGLRAERVRAVRIDHLERGLQMTMTRDEGNAWRIVDPLDYPAEAGMLERLLEVLSRNTATVVDKPDLAGMSFAPPRAVLEVSEDLPSGVRKLRLELGARALDNHHVFVRVEGQVLRTLVNLDSTLDHDLADWRQRRISNIDPATVVELRRIGRVQLDPTQTEPMDLSFEAGTTETGWRSSVPWNAALDPSAMEAMLANLCYMQARGFVADSAAQVPAFGLDQPELRVELSLSNGMEEVLLFRRNAESESWLCMREGSTHIFQVDEVNVVYLAVPADGFLDNHLARVERDKLERIELRQGDQALLLRREGAAWMMRSEPRDAASPEVFADAVAVEDLLAAVVAARIARFLVFEDALEFEQDTPLSLKLFTKGAEYACEFGASHAVSPGVPGRLFRRVGDDVVGVIEARIAALASAGWSAFVERQMIKLPEKAIARIELSRKDVRRVFVRNSETGRWSPEGVDAEAPKAFQKCIERLLSLRADTAVSPDEPFELVDPWDVVVVDGAGFRTPYRVGRLASDPAQQGFAAEGLRGIVTSSGLLEDLERIP